MSDESKVIQLDSYKKQKQDDRRKTTERIFMTHVLGVYCVFGNNNLHQIELVDLSEGGCSFQVPFSAERKWSQPGDRMPLRLYFNQDSYLEINVTVKNSTPLIQNGMKMSRYGCEVDANSSSFQTYTAFVKFLKLYADQAKSDGGKVNVYFV